MYFFQQKALALKSWKVALHSTFFVPGKEYLVNWIVDNLPAATKYVGERLDGFGLVWLDGTGLVVNGITV